jgi:hypothetical protein
MPEPERLAYPPLFRIIPIRSNPVPLAEADTSVFGFHNYK